jgi:hypothetical protein
MDGMGGGEVELRSDTVLSCPLAVFFARGFLGSGGERRRKMAGQLHLAEVGLALIKGKKE